MVDPLIEELVAEFITIHNTFHVKSTAHPLDFSYESLAKVDIFLRSIEELGAIERNDNLLKSASAYIGLSIYEILKKLNRKQTLKISLRTLPHFEVYFEINSKTEGKSVIDLQVPIFTSLQKIHNTKSGHLFFFDKLSTLINANTRKYLQFCVGVIAGASPFASGGWREVELNNLAIELDQITSVIAIEISKRNTLNYPTSTFLTDPTFFKYDLILPQLGYDEAFPGMRAIAAIAPKLQKHEDHREVQKTFLALLSSPDELQSSIGYILASTSNDDILLNLAANFACSFWPNTKDLRPATLLANTIFKKEGHWLKALGSGDKKLALSILRREQQLGLSPYLIAPIEENMLEQENVMFLEMLTLSQLENAYSLSALFENREKISPWLGYQLIFLDTLLNGLNNIDETNIKLDLLVTNNNYSPAWSLKSRLMLLKGDINLAFNNLKTYLNLLDKKSVCAQDKNLLVLFLTHLLRSKLDEAKKSHYLNEIIDIALEKESILSWQSFFLINLQRKEGDKKIILETLNPASQIALKNSTWSQFFNFHP